MKTSRVISLGLAVFVGGCGGGDDEGTSGPEACDTSVVGDICTLIGSGENGYDPNADTEAIPALEARLSLPQDTLTAADGTVYVLDWNNHRIRRLDPDGMLRWVAGFGELGGGLDDPANSDFNHPTNMIFDRSGDRLIVAAWHNSKIRTVSLSTGEVVDACGDGKRAYFGDGGPAAASSLDLPTALAIDPQGRLVIMDQANQVIRRIEDDGTIVKMAGQCIYDAPAPAGPGACAEGVAPVQCPAGPNGVPSGKWTCGDPAATCATSKCTPGYAGDGGPASEMRMNQPFGQSATPAGRMAYSADGELYFADTGNSLIRKIDRDGNVQRVAGRAPVDGVPQHGYEGDGGPATDALLDTPVDLAFGEDGTLYFSDVFNHCVRAIDPSGTIRTVAGKCGEKGTGGDGGPATEARLKLPFGVEYADGVLHIADSGNMVIRSVRVR